MSSQTGPGRFQVGGVMTGRIAADAVTASLEGRLTIELKALAERQERIRQRLAQTLILLVGDKPFGIERSEEAPALGGLLGELADCNERATVIEVLIDKLVEVI